MFGLQQYSNMFTLPCAHASQQAYCCNLQFAAWGSSAFASTASASLFCYTACSKGIDRHGMCCAPCVGAACLSCTYKD